MSGKTHTAETKAAIGAANSVALLGNTNRLGTTHTAESIDIIRLNYPHRKPVFVYDLENKLVGEFLSQNLAAKFLKCNISSVSRNVDTGKRLRKIYLITTVPLS